MFKRALIALLSIGFVLVIAIFVVLLPAHRQIQGIEPALPEFPTIERALDVSDTPVSVRYINSASQRSEAGTLGHPGVLIEWQDGRRFLIDTGMPPDKAVAFGKPIELLLGAEPTQVYGSLASQLGARVQDVRGVAFTHLHSDHTDGLPEICGRQADPAIVYQTPLQFRERNHTTDMGFAALEEAVCERRELERAAVMALPGFPGLVAVSLGGHTPGSTLFIVRLKTRYLAFSGDTTNDRKSLRENLPKHWLYSTLVVPENTQRTEFLRHWLRQLDDREDITVFPAHDVAFMATELPAVSASGVAAQRPMQSPEQPISKSH